MYYRDCDIKRIKSIEPVGIMLMVKKLGPSTEVWTQTTQVHIEMKFHVSVFFTIQVCVLIILLTETHSTSVLFWVSCFIIF